MKNVMMIALLMVGFSSLAQADSQVTLQQGQCASVDGQNYCWFYRPTTWDHPDRAPLPCDFRKDCPLTILVPTTANSPNMHTVAMDQQLQENAQARKVVHATDPNTMFFCRKGKDDNYALYRVTVEGRTKNEVSVNEYGDDGVRCTRDETRFNSSSNQEAVVESAVNGPVVVDTYRAPTPCPQNTIYKTEIRQIPVHNITKSIRRLF